MGKSGCRRWMALALAKDLGGTGRGQCESKSFVTRRSAILQCVEVTKVDTAQNLPTELVTGSDHSLGLGLTDVPKNDIPR